MGFWKTSTPPQKKVRKGAWGAPGTWLVGAAEGDQIAILTDPSEWTTDEAMAERISSQAAESAVGNAS